MTKIEFEPIGIIRTSFKKLEGIPIQPKHAGGAKGKIEVFKQYHDGLKDLDGFSHIVLLYYLHASKGYKMLVVPYLDTQKRGLFATRAPKRPNAIGLSVVRLERIEGGVIDVSGVDILDKTPLLDIKPYVPAFDDPAEVRLGWLEKAARKAGDKKADGRFT